jgi:hypothetical protein
MVAALTPFKSSEMGLLVITMFSDGTVVGDLARARIRGDRDYYRDRDDYRGARAESRT